MKKIHWVGLWSPTVHSIGDHAQMLAIEKWFTKVYPDYDVVKYHRSTPMILYPMKRFMKPKDLIFIHSSGDFGDFYGTWHKTRKQIIASFPNNLIIQLPVTVHYINKGNLFEDTEFFKDRKNLLIMCRDPASYQIVKDNFDCHSMLVSDFVYSLKPKLTNHNRKGAMVVLREDQETNFNSDFLMRFRANKFPRYIRGVARAINYPYRKFKRFGFIRKIKDEYRSKYGTVVFEDVQVSNEDITDEKRERIVSEVLEYYQRFELVVTDRLHGMIFSELTNTSCLTIRGRIPHKIWNTEKIDYHKLRERIEKSFKEEEPKINNSYKINSDDLLQLIKGRRSIRKWTNQEVELDLLQKIVVAGSYAPSGANTQKTVFKIISDKNLIQQVAKQTSPWFKYNHPNKIIAVLFDLAKPNPLKINYLKPHKLWSRFIWQDTSASMMNMMLMAEALGLKSCWVSVHPKREHKIRNLLKLSKSYILTCLLFLGYSDQQVNLETARHQGSPLKRSISTVKDLS